MSSTHPNEKPCWLGDFIELGPAEFLMGSSAEDRYATTTEQCAHPVAIPHRFALGVFPVTVGQWEFREIGTLPMVQISWNDIQTWLIQARKLSGLPLRLPAEVEWEFAARAGSLTSFPQGESISPTEANFLHDDAKSIIGPGHLTTRGTYLPNAFGLEDMLGNVAEWTADCWTPTSPDGPRVVRSGGWDSLPRLIRLSARYPLPRDRRQDNLGFRIAYDLP